MNIIHIHIIYIYIHTIYIYIYNPFQYHEARGCLLGIVTVHLSCLVDLGTVR